MTENHNMFSDTLKAYAEHGEKADSAKKAIQSYFQDIYLNDCNFEPMVEIFNQQYKVYGIGTTDANGAPVKVRCETGKKMQKNLSSILGNAYSRLNDEDKKGIQKRTIKHRDGAFFIAIARKKAETAKSIPELLQAISDGCHGKKAENVDKLIDELNARLETLPEKYHSDITAFVRMILPRVDHVEDQGMIHKRGMSVDIKEMIKEGDIRVLNDVTQIEFSETLKLRG